MRALIAALRLLTIVPMPGIDSPASRRASAIWFPVAGALIGMVSASALLLGRAVSPLLGAALAVGALAAATGALHLDGLADCFDGLGSGDRARRLEIMRDSRVGTYGVAALVLLVLLKVAALASPAAPSAARALIASAAVARLMPVGLAGLLPHAHRGRMGAMFVSEVTPARLAVAGVLAPLLAAAAVGATAVPMLLVAALVAALVGAWAHRALGGITGDVLGASVELTEAASLCVAAALL